MNSINDIINDLFAFHGIIVENEVYVINNDKKGKKE